MSKKITCVNCKRQVSTRKNILDAFYICKPCDKSVTNRLKRKK